MEDPDGLQLLRIARLPLDRVTVWLARVGFLSIAAATFGLSFDAIRDVAIVTGAVDPGLAWIVPLAIDGMIVTATAVLWTESLSGRGWHLFPLAAIIVPAALSGWANVAHAAGGSFLGQVLAAVPPAGLILSLELVAWQIRRERDTTPPPGRASTEQAGSLKLERSASTFVAAPSTNGTHTNGASANGGRSRGRKVGLPALRTLVPDIDTYHALVDEHGGVTAAADALHCDRQRLSDRRRELTGAGRDG